MDIVIAAVKDNHVAFLHIVLNFLLAMASYPASLSTFQRYMVEVKRSHQRGILVVPEGEDV